MYYKPFKTLNNFYIDRGNVKNDLSSSKSQAAKNERIRRSLRRLNYEIRTLEKQGSELNKERDDLRQIGLKSENPKYCKEMFQEANGIHQYLLKMKDYLRTLRSLKHALRGQIKQ
jgi:hypothetical protein